ncbi:hypothetical protein IFR05_009756 [Cadophora sp. M221]|nr:hypothetical protein IFR05_009756 [Cadophora sp. M221]
MSLASASQLGVGPNANAGPDPGAASSSQLYDDQAFFPSGSMAATGLAAGSSFDLGFGFLPYGGLTGFSPDPASFTCDNVEYSPETPIPRSHNMQVGHPRSISALSPTKNNFTTETYPSFQSSMQAGLFDSSLAINSTSSASTSSSVPGPTPLKASHILSYLCQDLERRSVVKIIGSEGLNLRDIVKLGLASLGTTMEVAQYESANNKPANIWIRDIISTYESCDIQLAVWTGMRVILQMEAQAGGLELATPFNRQGTQVYLQHDTNIYTNTITLKVSPWMSASLANAEFLGITYESLMLESSESPFTQQPTLPFKVDNDITTDMTPTAVQYTKSHHPYLDLIPWPSFRSKAIIAISVTPPLIDEEDLCLDLMNNALRCWGSMRSQHGRGEGTPWDMRSWEAAPWFIAKWAMLMDGDGGEIARNSAWWRNQKGMSSLN